MASGDHLSPTPGPSANNVMGCQLMSTFNAVPKKHENYALEISDDHDVATAAHALYTIEKPQ